MTRKKVFFENRLTIANTHKMEISAEGGNIAATASRLEEPQQVRLAEARCLSPDELSLSMTRGSELAFT